MLGAGQDAGSADCGEAFFSPIFNQAGGLQELRNELLLVL